MKPRVIIVHCSATPNDKECKAETIDRWHKAAPFHFDRIGYHAVIQPDGYLENCSNSPCRALNEMGAHVKGANMDSIGICMIGTDRFGTDQFKMLRNFIAGVRITFDIPPWGVRCHYEYPSAVSIKKTCPNIPINRLTYWLATDDWRCLKPYLLGEN